jgi:hypothetical protein
MAVFLTGALVTASSYWQFMHDQFPILDTSKAVPEIRDNTPFLFWTIVVVTCRYHPRHHPLFAKLQIHYRHLLRSAMATSPASISTIQSLLILCYWPLPCEKQPHDPSWHICGVILNAALFQGLHLSNTQQAARMSQHSREVRSRTWLACLYISTLYVILASPCTFCTFVAVLLTILLD